MTAPFSDGSPRFHGLYEATVMENVDPEGKWRVRAKVDGITDLCTWARPHGTIGGGGPQRGGWVVPDIGADVFVQFVNGDVERPVYSCDGWAEPAAGSEMPRPARDVPPEEAHLVPSLQLCGGRLSVYVDGRPGKRKLVLEDLELGDAIVWDLEEGGLRVKMTSAILLEVDGLLRAVALQATVNGRLVETSPKPI